MVFAAHGAPLLGHRFLLLTHRGRRTGRTYSTVLEVLSWDGAAREAVVISGFGPRSQWVRNVLAADAAEIEIGREHWRAAIRPLGPAEGAAVLADYERRNRLVRPLLRRVLSRLAGIRYDGTERSRRAVARRLPLIAFSPDRVASQRLGRPLRGSVSVSRTRSQARSAIANPRRHPRSGR